MTTDPERIREWAESRDAVPVSTHGGEGHGFSFARQEELGPDQEERSWDEFAQGFRDDELVCLYRDDESAGERGSEDSDRFEVLEREAALERAAGDRAELEDALRRGETVPAELVESEDGERQAIDRERDGVESAVVDTEVVDRELVGTELLDRDVVETAFVGDDVVEVTTAESRLETIEEVERYTVESEVDRSDPRADSSPGLESVRRSVLEDALPRSAVTADEIDREVVRNKRADGDVVRSELLERRTVEERIDERVRRRFTLEETDVVDSTAVDSDVLEGELVDPDEYETSDGRAGGAETTATGEPVPGTEPIVGELTDDDVGKEVVDDSGTQIGMVSDVEGNTAYVDPEPGLTDRLKARLNWLERDDDDRPIRRSRIGERTDDELVLRADVEDEDE